ncbi:MAG: NAD-dependent epimerase/dehydratase family protein [Opitutales bacterium]
MAAPKHILVTGLAGRVGHAVWNGLKDGPWQLSGLDRVDAPADMDVPWTTCELTDRAAIDRAMAGVDCVVHLAGKAWGQAFPGDLADSNVVGAWNVFDAAREAGVPRVLFASSAQVLTGYWDRGIPMPWSEHDAVDPANPYALTKVLKEDIGRYFARQHNLSVVAVRIGWVVQARRVIDKISGNNKVVSIYLSHRDCGRFFRLAVEADRPAPGEFVPCFLTSRTVPPVPHRLQLGAARELCGYEPQDVWPEGLPDDWTAYAREQMAEQANEAG